MNKIKNLDLRPVITTTQDDNIIMFKNKYGSIGGCYDHEVFESDGTDDEIINENILGRFIAK